ncbi:MAG: glycosyltransferase family 2 protein [Bacteroides sp.]|nr:glycosyltransferase family 2 protein [Prevotella sp.]MCM1408179.1 glycosyltransferase family 2 protein [Treponema brennaborense]MCM1469503.1 glycosyltransferase family 2 protein [Bacteroides sp.]
MKDAVSIYNGKRSLFKNEKPENITAFFRKAAGGQIFPPNFARCIQIAVVIPLFDEYPGFFKTLYSAEKSYYSYIRAAANDLPAANSAPRLHIVCVVNNRKSSPQSVKENNRQLIAALKLRMHSSVRTYAAARAALFCSDLVRDKRFDAPCAAYPPLSPIISLIDSASERHEMPENQGAGYARKLGMDYALLCGASVIACLDGDTLAGRNWFSHLCAFAQKNRGKTAAAVTRFHHQRAENTSVQNAARLYESYLSEHAEKLKQCGTPYWHTALGPVIVCTAEAYAAAGGMNLRTAGEDFYFLQQLVKITLNTDGMQMLECTVYPSARLSNRVLFGTGTRLKQLVLNGGAENKAEVQQRPAADDPLRNPLLFPEEIYAAVARFISLFEETYGIARTAKQKRAVCSASPHNGRKSSAADSDARTELFISKISCELPAVYEFLCAERFPQTWRQTACANRKNPRRLENAFHCWFDGLKIIRLAHFLEKRL